MNMSFKKGDVVQLKSGGPNMTVHSTWSSVSGESVNCEWFNGPNQIKRQFIPEMLVKVDSELHQVQGDWSFKNGEVVLLRSGGPRMTVHSTWGGISGVSVNCEWLNGPNQMKGQFGPETLVKVDAS